MQMKLFYSNIHKANPPTLKSAPKMYTEAEVMRTVKVKGPVGETSLW